VYWGEHTRREITEGVKILALGLLGRFDEHISAQLQLLQYNRVGNDGLRFSGKGGPTGFTGLHGVAFLGIAAIVSAVLELKEWDVNAYDCMGMTALTWAAARGHEEVVMMFLGREGVDPNQADTRYGQTPLSWAAEKGHEGIIRMLLGREGVSPDQPDTKYGRTPLCWAAKNGHEGIVKMLLERDDVNPDQPNTEYDRTPLSWAAENGHEGIVKMLSERKHVCTTMTDNTNQTPQPLPLPEGHDAVVSVSRECDNFNCTAADHGSPASLPPSAVNRDECAAGILSRSHNSGADITDFNGQPEPVPEADHQPSRLLDPGDSIPNPADSGPLAKSPS